MDEIEQDLLDGASRRVRWLAWESEFWRIIEATLGRLDVPAAYRKFRDVWIMVDFRTNDGQVDFAVCEDPGGVAGGMLSGYLLRAYWDRFEAKAVAERVLTMVDKVRSDPIFRIRHRGN
jgi:hypothetical protein